MTQHPITLSTAADTLAAIPALLGFHPENSVVIIALAKNARGVQEVVVAMRVDAHHAEPAAAQIAATTARQQFEGTPVSAVVLVAIADVEHAGAALLGIDALEAELAHRNITTDRAMHAYTLTAGAIFTDLHGNEDGIVPDPATTDYAMALAVEGTVIARSRQDIAARFAPGTEIPEFLALRAAATMGEDFLPVTYDELAAVIGAREIPSADLTARVGLALATGQLEVRDVFLSMAVHGHTDAADTFTRMAARLRGTARAHALSLAAFFLYCTGNTAATALAIEAVEATADTASIPVPSFTALVRRALNAGMAPDMVASIGDAITPAYVAEHIGRVQSYT